MPVVHVEANVSQYYNGFCRGGHFWPKSGRTVEVSKELLDVLKADRTGKLIISDGKAADAEGVKLELIAPPKADPEAAELEALEAAKRRNAALKARREREQLEKENAKLEAELAKQSGPNG